VAVTILGIASHVSQHTAPERRTELKQPNNISRDIIGAVIKQNMLNKTSQPKLEYIQVIQKST